MKTRKRILLFCLLPLVLGATIFASGYELQRRWQRQTLASASAHLAAARAVKNAVAAVPAQSGGSFNLPQTVIAGGGARSSGGSNVIEGTLGQSSTSQSSGGTYAIAGGFWPGAVDSQCPTISLTPATLPNGNPGVAYPNQTFTASNGSAPYTFSMTGTLPPGLTFTPATALLAGTPTTLGLFNFTITATDANQCTGSQNYAVTINCPAITVNPATLPNGTAGAVYGQNLTQTGGSGALTFSVSAGALPGGLSLNSTSGLLSGAPTGPGPFNFTVRATDVNNCFGERAYAITIFCQAITIIPATLPNGTTGVAYTQTFTQSGALGTVNFLLTGTLPNGLSFNAGTATLAGTPTQAGSFPITVTATEANSCAGLSIYTLVINPPGCPTITVNPATLPNGILGQPYNQTITATGGNAPHTFAVTLGALPNGLTLAAGGALTGVPIVSGTFNFTVTATDASNCPGARVYTLDITNCPTITVNPATLPNGFVGTPYSQTFTASGGTAPYTFSVSAGAPPNGLNLNTGTGALTGTPSVQTTFNFTVRATDANGCTGTRAYTVIISGNGLMFFPLPQPVRLLETRVGFSGCTTPGVPINANGTLTLPARTTCAGIPANAAAVTGNITVVPSGPGFLTLFPSSAAQPTVANSNFGAGEITNNVFTVGLGASDGAFKIFSSATTHVIVDVTGYYAPPSTGGLYFHPLATPVRLLETRAGFTGCIAPGVPLTGTGNPNADPNLDLLLQGRSPVAAPCNSIPATAQVLVGNATSVLPSALGYLTIYPSGGTRPTVASSNYAGADVINGPFAVKLGTDGKFKIYTFATTHLVVDILGYYSTDATDANGAGLLFNPLPSPVRLLETRPGFAGCTMTGAPIVGNLANATHTQMAANFCGLPASAQAVVGNVSVVNTTGAGFLTLFPANLTTAPLVATSNYPAPATFGYNRHFFVGLSPADGKFKVLTQFTTDLILDASGYFAP